mmetsp:Transcript_15468/g.30822  ORF Transcript_15468/g.30822 Transcript_15468/m.30822 type:complete len:473 (-) Transcript_15468:233-1651(-)
MRKPELRAAHLKVVALLREETEARLHHVPVTEFLREEPLDRVSQARRLLVLDERDPVVHVADVPRLLRQEHVVLPQHVDEGGVVHDREVGEERGLAVDVDHSALDGVDIAERRVFRAVLRFAVLVVRSVVGLDVAVVLVRVVLEQDRQAHAVFHDFLRVERFHAADLRVQERLELLMRSLVLVAPRLRVRRFLLRPRQPEQRGEGMRDASQAVRGSGVRHRPHQGHEIGRGGGPRHGAVRPAGGRPGPPLRRGPTGGRPGTPLRDGSLGVHDGRLVVREQRLHLRPDVVPVDVQTDVVEVHERSGRRGPVEQLPARLPVAERRFRQLPDGAEHVRVHPGPPRRRQRVARVRFGQRSPRQLRQDPQRPQRIPRVGAAQVSPGPLRQEGPARPPCQDVAVVLALVVGHRDGIAVGGHRPAVFFVAAVVVVVVVAVRSGGAALRAEPTDFFEEGVEALIIDVVRGPFRHLVVLYF